MNAPSPLRRSLLYVPGDQESMLAKAASRGADGLILNLEDAVAPAHKELARQAVTRALETRAFGDAEVIVRINPLETDTGYRDLLAIIPHGPDAILLPKVSDPESVRFAAWTVERLERLNALTAGRIEVMCMIESAAGLLAAAEIARSSPRLTALILGANDLAEDLGCAPDPDGFPLLQAASQVVLAAKAAAVALATAVTAIDTPHMNIRDADGLVRSSRKARELGFDGKSAIHPGQIAAIHAAFAPTQEQVAWAKRVLALLPEGDPTRLGAALIDGQLIEAPHVARARKILAAEGRS